MLLPNRLFQDLPDVWTTLRNPPISVNLIDLDLQRKIANSKDLDMEAIEAIDTLLNKGPTHLQRDLEDWATEEFEGKNVLFFQGKNYIPKDYELRREITSQFHDKITAGHPGEEHGLCYGVKRRKESRSGTSQNPQTPTPNLTPTKNNKSHVL